MIVAIPKHWKVIPPRMIDAPIFTDSQGRDRGAVRLFIGRRASFEEYKMDLEACGSTATPAPNDGFWEYFEVAD